MPTFDVTSELNWQELDNAINQANKEIGQRFDFKSVKVEIKLDQKAKTVTLWCSEEGKLEAVIDVFQNKCIKRGLSTLSFDFTSKVEAAFGSSVRQVVPVQAGISKEKGKEIIAAVKESKLKAQAQIQDEQVRVSGNSRDVLQDVISLLRGKQQDLKVPLQFGNFRD
ncbi:MAG: YajQ family cyclic di-GMP-binding protein [Bacteriovoracia bacterium]